MTLASLGVLGLVFLSAAGLTRWLCSPASKLALLDHPSERSLHTAPVSRTGGLAVFGGVMVGLLFGLALKGSQYSIWRDFTVAPGEAGLWILGIVLVIGVVSFWDDQTNLPVELRLSVHALAAGGAVWGGRLTIDPIAVPFLGKVSLGWIAVPVTILFFMWMTNLYNFMDGMDGFAAGMTVLGYGFLGFLAWKGGHQFIMLLSFLIAAAAGGFLLYNLPPARIFMGDVGSVSLGFMAAALAVMGVQDGLFDLWVPLLIFSPFIVDATVTLVRRLLRGEKVWQAHREHYYQRLVLAGWGHRKTMLAEYFLMVACGITAVAYGQAGESWRLAILLGWVVVYIFLALGVRGVERRANSLRVA